MRDKKLKDLMGFMIESIDEIQKDENFMEWTAEDIFRLASDVALNEFSANGTSFPLARVESDKFAFCFKEIDEDSEIIVIHGEGLFDD